MFFVCFSRLGSRRRDNAAGEQDRQGAHFAESLPFATYRGKHDVAAGHFATCDALIVMVQESRHLYDNATICDTSARSFVKGHVALHYHATQRAHQSENNVFAYEYYWSPISLFDSCSILLANEVPATLHSRG